MEKGKLLATKREATRKRKATCRKDLLMIAYVGRKHPFIYKEAETYFNKLNELYPTKLDLRKTIEFRALHETPMESIKDKMCLEIPLASASTIVEECPLPTNFETIEECPLPANLETIEDCPLPANLETIEECPLPEDLESIEDMMKDELPEDLIENIIKELKADPNIAKIMEEIEALVYKESNPYDDIDIDFETDDRLENELIAW